MVGREFLPFPQLTFVELKSSCLLCTCPVGEAKLRCSSDEVCQLILGCILFPSVEP